MRDRQIRPRVLSDSEVENVVLQLRTIDHKSAWERVLEVGRVVFEGVVGGDEVEWRSRRSNKNLSLRRLIRHPACPFGKTALGGAVNVHLFVRLNPSVAELRNLTPTHVMQVAGLPNDQALELLRRTADEGWSIRELSQQTRRLRKQAGDRRGRPISPAEQKAETMAHQAAALLRRMLDQLAALSALDDQRRRSLYAAIEDLSELLTELRGLPILRRTPSAVLPVVKASLVEERKKAVG